MKPSESLRKAAEIYEQRNKVYGGNYKRFGHAFYTLLREVEIGGPNDTNRLGILIQVMSKLSRYCENFNRGGHDDSLDDLAVYAMMLKELDIEARERGQDESGEVL